MPDLYSSSALSALNEKDYINKLYDSNSDTTKKLLQENYTQNGSLLDSEQQTAQDQTSANIDRTNVESQQSQNSYTGPKLTLGASAQEALTRNNTTLSNVNTLTQKQTEIDAEIERQRQLLASQYSAAIEKAQADNDMERAQQLYDAAKAEEEQLLSLKLDAATLLSNAGDNSLLENLLDGKLPSVKYSGKTWKEVLKNESSINDIYDNQLKSKLLELQTENEEKLSDLAAKRQKRAAETDSKLTQAYVDALQKAKNYAEVQGAYGQGSGTAAAARIAQDTGMQDELTRLRELQMGYDAGYGMDTLDQYKTYRNAVASSTQDINSQRADALIKAAEEEERKLYETQLTLGEQLASQGDYSVLGKLYGLSEDEIALLESLGASAAVYSTGSSGSSGSTTTDPYASIDFDALTKQQAAIDAAAQERADLLALTKYNALQQSKANSSTSTSTVKPTARV